MLLFCLLCTQYIHTITFIKYIHPSPFARFLSISSAQWEKPPWDAEPRIELGPALQQADALPSELSRTLLSYAAPKLSYAAP